MFIHVVYCESLIYPVALLNATSLHLYYNYVDYLPQAPLLKQT